MRLLIAALAVTCLLVAGYAVVAMRDQPLTVPLTPKPEAAGRALVPAQRPRPPAPPSASAGEKPARDEAPTVRPVAPEIVAAPEVDVDRLERMEPRPPLSDIGPAGALKRERRPGTPTIFRPVAVAAGRVEAGDLAITIAGIVPVEPEERCARDNGGDWPCGMAARTAFRGYLRGRALDCDLPDGDLPERLTTTCRLGQGDVGAWLVANGWARVSADGRYDEEAGTARSSGLGIYGAGPRALPPAEIIRFPAAEPPPLKSLLEDDGLAEGEAELPDGR